MSMSGKWTPFLFGLVVGLVLSYLLNAQRRRG